MTYNLDFSKNLLLVAMLAISSILSLSMLTNSVLAAPDKFGIDELYRTVNDGPTWFLDNKDPEEDDNFLLTSAKHIKLHDEDSGVFKLNAETGTQKHGVRIHADSPDDEWKNVEMTGYFKLKDGNDQFTLIARQGPTYNDDGGCGAYGYYGLLDANGDAYFKKKLFHHGGYTDRTAVEENVVDNLDDRWVGIKMVTYDLDDDKVKLELWVDDGDEENHWKKATEYVDDGDWKVHGSDCDRDSDDIIDDGTRGGFRVDDSEFEFKDLSIREIDADHRAADDNGDQGSADDNGDQGVGEQGLNKTEVLTDLQQIADLAGITDSEGLADLAGASDTEEVADLAGASDTEELLATPGITDSDAIDAIASVGDLEGLADLAGASDTEELLQLVIHQPPAEGDEQG
jgi:hypothetical protein